MGGKATTNFRPNCRPPNQPSRAGALEPVPGPHLSVVGAGGIGGTLGRCLAVLLPLQEPQAHHVGKGHRAHGQQLHIPAHLRGSPGHRGWPWVWGTTEGCPGLGLLGQALAPVLGRRTTNSNISRGPLGQALVIQPPPSTSRGAGPAEKRPQPKQGSCLAA